ncbi:FCD domain-containing protein [Paracoccus kondratievae]|uniref:Pyruvate dehydrogenase complex repressor n=1 Tax=Paracoccus kondratievae TaxID=135740 RepID=A0AAD3RTU1_9RHOB|nr:MULTISPECIES: FCD domain-containing protein [Paracoccus]QFQ88989.1 FCD domain-containing protein [Paracoccus kondratievae]GLK64155.1 GntR family transcriptional regulator [Paracoccus kondratievae]SMG52370.1 transcriptional regulator, GntR family [Paracoccus sp. J56]
MASEVNKGISAAETTARHIEDLILEGSLRPGDSLLAERELALRLNVSRPTLRQGIRMLEDKGLIVAEPGGARRVAPLATSITDPLIVLMASRPEVVDDYLELRGTLEGMAANLAATRANDVDRATLTRCMERIDEAHDKADFRDEAEADVDLHVAVYEASHNIVLLQIMRALSGMLRKGVFHNREKLYARPEVREVLRSQHRAIYNTIMARDPEAAARAARDHMVYTQRVRAEIIAAEARLEISLRRIEGGSLTPRN